MLLPCTGIFDAGFFKGAKAYRLQYPRDDEKATFLNRMRGVSRKFAGALDDAHYGQDPTKNAAVVAGPEMRSTTGMIVLMIVQGKVGETPVRSADAVM